MLIIKKTSIKIYFFHKNTEVLHFLGTIPLWVRNRKSLFMDTHNARCVMSWNSNWRLNFKGNLMLRRLILRKKGIWSFWGCIGWIFRWCFWMDAICVCTDWIRTCWGGGWRRLRRGIESILRIFRVRKFLCKFWTENDVFGIVMQPATHFHSNVILFR